MKEDERAIADFERALAISPDDATALLRRGEARLRLGDRDGARADLERVVELQPAWKDYVGKLLED